MLGGYEYTPEAMNARSDELLRDKHNEALLVAPRLFSEAGWKVTMSDPLSMYDANINKPFEPYPLISCVSANRKYKQRYLTEMKASGTLKEEDSASSSNMVASHLFMFSVLQSSPPAVRYALYDDGKYFQMAQPSFADSTCLPYFAHLHYMDSLTDNKASGNTYTFICNELTHSPEVLKEPEYIPASGVYENKATCGYYKWVSPPSHGHGNDLGHYHVNAAAMLQTAKWLDKLRTLSVYDNTRIIIVGDHGYGIHTPVDFAAGLDAPFTCAAFNPLLIVKDFGAHGTLQQNNTFMTNADLTMLSKQGLDISGINPFTHKSLSAQADKSEVRIYRTVSRIGFNEWSARYMQQKTQWILDEECNPVAVHDNMFDEHNWRWLYEN